VQITRKFFTGLNIVSEFNLENYTEYSTEAADEIPVTTRIHDEEESEAK